MAPQEMTPTMTAKTVNLSLLSLKFQLLAVMHGQTTMLAKMTLLHMQGGRRQGPGFYFWQTRRDASLSSLKWLLDDLV